MGDFLRGSCCFALPVFAFVSLRIWQPRGLGGPALSPGDRIAWTTFTLGACLMVNMALYAMACEDGSFRSWDTIRLHARVFLGLSMVAVVGPLVVFACQVAGKSRGGPDRKVPPGDEWE